ncbi:ankyrin repeat-containing domain protein [Schizophyllum fasciatum]
MAQEVIDVFRDIRDANGILDVALRVAAQIGHVGLVTLLIDDLHASVEAQSSRAYAFTPLHFAARYGRRAVVDLLLDRKAAIDSRDQDGMTPLHCAASHGQSDVVAALLQRGANIAAVDNSGWSAVHFAVDNGHLSSIETLLEAGADANARSNDGQTPLHRAAKKVRPDVIRLLVRRGANRDALDRFGNSPLRLAIYWREIDAVNALMEGRSPFSDTEADAEITASGKWKDLKEDRGRDARIRDLLRVRAKGSEASQAGGSAVSTRSLETQSPDGSRA